MKKEVRYYVIIENGEERYLKTHVSDHVMRLMLNEYRMFILRGHGSDEEWSFQKFLGMHGIQSIYDGTFGYFDVDNALLEDKEQSQ